MLLVFSVPGTSRGSPHAGDSNTRRTVPFSADRTTPLQISCRRQMRRMPVTPAISQAGRAIAKVGLDLIRCPYWMGYAG